VPTISRPLELNVMIQTTAQRPETHWNDLVLRMAGGDREAFAALYDATARLVYTVCLRILRSPEDAEEAAHETYVRAWRLAGRFDPTRGSATAWLIILARSGSIDRLRQRSLRAGAALHELPYEPTDPAAGPDETAAVALRAARVRAALATLSPAHREVLELAFFGHMTHTELATHLRMPLGTVKTRIRAGLARLREVLTEARDSRGYANGRSEFSTTDSEEMLAVTIAT
jgi:RNA polymerase sigma-70 factor, ECF subfamily